MRSANGELVEIESIWVAEAEHVHGMVISAAGRSESRVWAQLLATARSRTAARSDDAVAMRPLR